jgi:uridylate kinase
VVLKATKVDGVYDSDPRDNPDAKLYESLTYETVQRLGLGVMDQTAITLCQVRCLPAPLVCSFLCVISGPG